MKRSILDLLALQTVDLRIRELGNRYKSIPAERAELVAEFNVVCKALEDAENNVKQLEMKIKSIEADITAKKTHNAEIRLRSDTIKKVADYNAAMADAAATDKAIAELEEQELECMESLEQAKAVVTEKKKNYRATGRIIQKEVGELDELKKAVMEEAKQKAVESQNLEKKVPAATLEVYKRLLATGKGTPVGAITSGICSNCSLKLPPMTLAEARKGKLVFCDNCSRYLYDPTVEDD